MTPVLRWIKAHLVIVLCVFVIVVAPAAAWYVTGGMNADLKERISVGSSRMSELDRLTKSSVSLEVPGGQPINMTTVINPKLLAAYKEAITKIGGEAQRVRQAGLARNREFNGVARTKDDIIRGLFPAPRASQRETLPFEMYDALVAKYYALLSDVGAADPPSPGAVAEVLARRRDQFVAGQRKDHLSELDESEQKDLNTQLMHARLNVYRSYVLGESTLQGSPTKPVRYYASMNSLDIPARPTFVQPLSELFDWQWRYWVAQDMLYALADANGNRSVLDGPVKRLIGMRVGELGADRGSAKSGGSGGSAMGGSSGGSFGMGGMGGAGGGTPGKRRPAGSNNSDSAGPTAPTNLMPGPPRIDPTREAKIDHGVSLTGRMSNDVYDVRTITCELIVATAGLPEVMDAIARRNFMTVLNASIVPADAFAAARDGFLYGIEPVSTLRLEIESVWFREWTAESMPLELREALGIQSDPPSTATTTTTPTADSNGVQG